MTGPLYLPCNVGRPYRSTDIHIIVKTHTSLFDTYFSPTQRRFLPSSGLLDFFYSLG